jgi:hypothetical protein
MSKRIGSVWNTTEQMKLDLVLKRDSAQNRVSGRHVISYELDLVVSQEPLTSTLRRCAIANSLPLRNCANVWLEASFALIPGKIPEILIKANPATTIASKRPMVTSVRLKPACWNSLRVPPGADECTELGSA